MHFLNLNITLHGVQSNSCAISHKHRMKSDSSLTPSVQDLETFTSDRNLTIPKQVMKPTPIYPDNESDTATDDVTQNQEHSLSDELDSESADFWVEEDPNTSQGFMQIPERGNNSTYSDRESSFFNRETMDHSLPGMKFPTLHVTCLDLHIVGR